MTDAKRPPEWDQDRACVQCGKTVEVPRRVYMTPMCYACLPPEPTTGAERPTIAGALSAMLRAKVIRVDQVHHIRAILEPEWNAALAEVQRERDAEKDELRITKRLFENMTVRCDAAEQREREAGATIKEKVLATLREMREKPMHEDCYCSECWHTGARNQAVESCISQIHAALAAIRPGPAQPAEPRSLFGWIGRRIGDHVQTADCDGTCLDCIDGGYGSDGLVKSAAPVSDPPTAKGETPMSFKEADEAIDGALEAVDGYRTQRRLVVPPCKCGRSKGSLAHDRTSLAGVLHLHDYVPVADPTETER